MGWGVRCLVAALFLELSACGGPGPSGGSQAQIAQASTPRDPASSIPASSLKDAVATNNAFAVDLFRHQSASFGANALTSPLSASFALTMAYAGARGETATEMAAALHIDSQAAQSVFDGQNALSQALDARTAAVLAAAQATAKTYGSAGPSPDDYQLSVVNSLWGERTEAWVPSFLTTLSKSYGAGIRLEDFAGQPNQARLAINDWVYSETQNKIANLLPPDSIDSLTRVVLVNAIHLKFPWANPFDASASAPAPFTRPDGSTVSPTLMNATLSLAYADDGQAQIAAIPLSDGNPVGDASPAPSNLSVVIALPHAGVDLTGYEAALTPSSAALTPPHSATLIQLSLPKVNFTTPTFSLKAGLQAMGMRQAFDPALADFSGIAPVTADRLYITDVFQKAMVGMQEQGVEAAAASAVVIGLLSAPATPPTPVPMVVNRPYLLSIVDSATGAVLFLGHVTDPTDVGSP